MALFVVPLFLNLVVGCITPQEKKDMQSDIFSMQTRVLTLERELADTSKETKGTADSASKRIASTRAELDRLTSELHRLRGEVDALRIGVVTGKMPGVVSDQEGSVAFTLAKIDERLNSLEQTQSEILDAISKAGVKKNSKKPATRKGGTSFSELEAAFNAKKYKIVTEDAPSLIKEGDPAEKVQALYFLAESHFKLGDMRVAAIKFNEFLESKPAKSLLPVVKMRLGDCFRNLGDADTARIYYEELIREYPGTNEANKAKERLAEITGGGQTSKG